MYKYSFLRSFSTAQMYLVMNPCDCSMMLLVARVFFLIIYWAFNFSALLIYHPTFHYSAGFDKFFIHNNFNIICLWGIYIYGHTQTMLSM